MSHDTAGHVATWPVFSYGAGRLPLLRVFYGHMSNADVLDLGMPDSYSDCTASALQPSVLRRPSAALPTGSEARRSAERYIADALREAPQPDTVSQGRCRLLYLVPSRKSLTSDPRSLTPAP
jgi:hypothetical protein